VEAADSHGLVCLLVASAVIAVEQREYEDDELPLMDGNSRLHDADPQPCELPTSCDGRTRGVEWMVGDDGYRPYELCSRQKLASSARAPHLPIHVSALVRFQLKQIDRGSSLSQQPRQQPELQLAQELH
jgi:hypothetical protein